jgi:hypothetical protein
MPRKSVRDPGIEKYLTKIHEALPHVEGWWISNKTCITDFKPERTSREEFLKLIGSRLGIEIDPKDTRVVAIAYRLRDKDNPRP